MTKKIICATIMTIFLLTQAVGAFALTVSTTTEWSVGEENAIVTSTVQGATVGEQVTYLAYTGSPAEGSIVYVDQKEAENATVTFEYIAKKPATLVTVKSGSNSQTASGDYQVGAISIKINDASYPVIKPVGEEDLVEISGFDATGVTSVSKKIGSTDSAKLAASTWTVASGVLKISNALLADGAEFTTSTEAAGSAAITVRTLKVGKSDDNKSIYMLGKVEGPATNFGLELDGPGDELDGSYYAAGSDNEGQFLIQLSYEDGATFAAGDYVMNAYAAGATDGVTKTVTITE